MSADDWQRVDRSQNVRDNGGERVDKSPNVRDNGGKRR